MNEVKRIRYFYNKEHDKWINEQGMERPSSLFNLTKEDLDDFLKYEAETGEDICILETTGGEEEDNNREITHD